MDLLVSIITPLHNSEKYIEAAIESILNQTIVNWELILVDDCSTDQSVLLVGMYIKQDSRIKLIKLEKNAGAAVARNVAIEASSGRYIAFLDSDDLWLPHKLEIQISFMLDMNCPFTYAAYDKINEFGKVTSHVGVPTRVNYNELLKTCVIGCLTAIYDTQYFGKVEMPLIRKRQDFGLWLRLLKKVDYAYGIQESLGRYRVRSDSISAKKTNVAVYTWVLYREIEKLSLIKASYFFAHYSVRGVLRTKFPLLARWIGILK